MLRFFRGDRFYNGDHRVCGIACPLSGCGTAAHLSRVSADIDHGGIVGNGVFLLFRNSSLIFESGEGGKRDDAPV